MRLGLQIIHFNYPNIYQHVRELAQATEEAGFYSLWTMDHFFQMEMVGGADQPMLEAYTMLGYLAALTQRVKLGALVTGVVYRHPGFLVKQIATLDTLSNGRAYLGMGAAWYEREAVGLGFPYPSTKTRFEQLEETLQIIHQMWKGDRTPFNGKHYTLPEPLNNPLPIQQPPLMIGGAGENKTLRMVAQYADATNLFAEGVTTVQHKLNVLRQHCDNLGRDYDSIEKTLLASGSTKGSGLQDAINLCHQYAPLGITHIIFNQDDYHDLSALRDWLNGLSEATANL
ncbi:MAG: LLM class F420-dependent oxidoreductase [Phototrophicaceae bacterium]